MPLRITPADGITLTILVVVVATISLRMIAGVPLAGPLLAHVGLLAGYTVAALLFTRYGSRGWVSPVRAVAVIGVMFTLYTTLAQLPFAAIPWQGDPALAQLERALFFGTSPVLWAEPHITAGRLEIFSFIYALFIPYLYMSIFLGLIGRPAPEREAFLTGFALLYALSFMGYLFVPARGPIVHQVTEFQTELAGGYFHDLVVSSIDRMGGPHGAFPSLHVGASAFACSFDLRCNRLRGLIYLPIVLLIAMSTVALRYHYVIDLLAGLLLALLALKVGGAWTERRGIL